MFTLFAPFFSGKLKTFASQAVRDGQPTLTLEQLRLALSAADFVEMEEQYFRKGDLVWVNGRFPASWRFA